VTASGGVGVIRRILVALDASADSLAALEAAAEIASALDAELAGLFVEDVRFVQAAALTMARAVQVTSGTERALELEDLERALRVQAQRIRDSIEETAGRRRVRWSLQVTRGEVAAEVLHAARDADLLLLGRSGRARRLGSVARAAAAGSPGPVLLLRAGTRIAPRILVPWDGSEIAVRALDLAASLARAGGGEITVLVEGTSREEWEAREAGAAARIASLDAGARSRRVAPCDEEGLVRLLRDDGGAVLVVGAGRIPSEPPAIERWLAGVQGPVLVLR